MCLLRYYDTVVLCLPRGVFKIHPSFRIVALSEPHVADSSSQQWLNSEQLTMFLYHNMRPLSWSEELDVIHKLVSATSLCFSH